MSELGAAAHEPTLIDDLAADIREAMHTRPAHCWAEDAARSCLRRIVSRLQAPYAPPKGAPTDGEVR